MAAFIAHNIAPIMFASLVVFLLLGYPVAFSLAGCGLFVLMLSLQPFAGVPEQTAPGESTGRAQVTRAAAWSST